MAMSRSLLFLVALSLAATASAAPLARTTGGSRHCKGPLLRAFAVSTDRYAAGQHHGVDLGASLGTSVRAVCPGRVTFAGIMPGGGRTVSVRCGHLIATYQQLGPIEVQRGEVIAPAAVLGVVGPSSDPRTRRPHVYLSARVAATGRHLDPLSLFGKAKLPVPLLPGKSRARRAPASARPGARVHA